MEMLRDFYCHLAVCPLEKPLKSKAQLGIQWCGLTCLNDLLDQKKGYLKIPISCGGDNVLWKEEEEKKKKQVKSNGNRAEFSKDSAKTAQSLLGTLQKPLKYPQVPPLHPNKPPVVLFVSISYDSLYLAEFSGNFGPLTEKKENNKQAQRKLRKLKE